MQGQDDRKIGEMRKRQARHVIEVYDVHRDGCVAHRPGGVILILQFGSAGVSYRPVTVRIPPFEPAGNPRLTVRIDRNVVSPEGEAAGEIRDEELGSTVVHWRHRYERRSDESDSHGTFLGCKKDSVRPAEPVSAAGNAVERAQSLKLR